MTNRSTSFFNFCRENEPPLPPAGLETSTITPPELTSSSVDSTPDIAPEEDKPSLESASTLDTLSLTNAREEESTRICGMDTESKSDSTSDLEACGGGGDGGVDENERLEFEDGDNSTKGMDQTMDGVTEAETGNNGNNEGMVHVCTDMGDQKESRKVNTEPSDHLDLSTCDSDDKNPVPAREMRKTKQQPTLLTMFAANSAAAQQQKQQKSLELEEKITPPASSTPLPTPAPSLTALDEFLLENDNKMMVDVPVIPAKPLTPMEKFQQRLMKHMSAPLSQPVRKEKKSTETGEEGGESALIPEDVITKLKDKPGELCCMY